MTGGGDHDGPGAPMGAGKSVAAALVLVALYFGAAVFFAWLTG